jgi:hypothetical protein
LNIRGKKLKKIDIIYVGENQNKAQRAPG